MPGFRLAGVVLRLRLSAPVSTDFRETDIMDMPALCTDESIRPNRMIAISPPNHGLPFLAVVWPLAWPIRTTSAMRLPASFASRRGLRRPLSRTKTNNPGLWPGLFICVLVSRLEPEYGTGFSR